MQIPILDLKAQYATYKSEALQTISEVCDSQLFALGPAVEEFERRIAAYCGCKYAIGVSSGTDALLVSLMALGIGPGDEVITSPFSFFSTAGSIARLGAKPVFADIDPDSYNIDPDSIRQKITTKTRAIIPVHMFGQVAQMKPIMEIARCHNLTIIEDAAQAMGATQDGTKCGNFGDCGCFSFYPTKNLSGFGDGGLVTTNDESLAEKIKILRNHGQAPAYYYKVIGGNFRLDGIQGAVLNVKLKYLDGWNEKRRQNAAIYDSFFADSPIKIPKIDPNNISIYHQYTIRVPERDKLQKFLADNKIGSAIFYPKPLHLQECFEGLGYRQGDLPITERLCNEVLSLPVYPELTHQQIEYVAKTVLKFYGLNYETSTSVNQKVIKSQLAQDRNSGA
jgi:dTDP-4-amino-4,6-dideoxygalactose transaminase